MQNGSNTWQQLLFSSLRGWKDKKKEQSSGQNLLKTWCAFTAEAQEQSGAQAGDLSLLESAVLEAGDECKCAIVRA